ncbi:MAG TPA: vitamin B12-dependent ribonucleotide reductase [Candidatus Limnocylindria bacterium]|jgi:ribonucleoside-diphosphate reductase alpha chain|nr:vitamin B12-dependent ribonucleotide reductase [Candidatus Limnocylindria bacterium]
MAIADIAPESVQRAEPKGLRIERRFTREGVHPYDEIEWELRDSAIPGEGGNVFEQKGVEVPKFWSQTATNVVASKYFRGKLGSPIREWSVKQMVDRVVDTIARAGSEGGYFASEADRDAFADELKYLMVNQHASFNSPVWFNIGVEGVPQQPSACFILNVQDDMHSILDWFRNEGVIFKGGSGSGVNVSRIRSQKEQLSGGGYASGPVSFMRGADSVAGSIKSGGTTRRAAKMVVLDADHPDVREFIWCKAREEKKAWALGEMGYDMSLNGEAWHSIQFQNANNSVRVADDFMRKAVAGESWALTARVDGRVLETVNAKDLLREIAEAAWECGDPGMQFDTACNDWHTRPNTGRNYATNPCSEFVSLDNTACNLASLNLMRFVNAAGDFDTSRFASAVGTLITAQEILVGYADYPTPEITVNARANRELGLGYANLGALLMYRGLPYDSDEGRAYSAAITALMTGEAYAQSARIAAIVGAYDEYRRNKEPHDHVIRMHRQFAYRIRDELVPASLLSAARQSWDDAVDLGKENGYRNAQVSLLAPTGTISFMLDCDTTGVEPDIALVKYKKLVGGGTMKLVNGTVPAALRRLGYTETETGGITSYIEQYGTIEGAPGLDAEHLAVFDCAFKPERGERFIHHMGHIKMMGAVQPFLSGAISKTVNLPETATVEDVMDAYVQAWKHGVKAIAIYRDGSKKVQPVNTSNKEANTKSAETIVERVVEVARPSRRRLADTRASLTHKFSIEGHEGYITVGLFEDNTPGELFVTMAKEGSTLSGMMDAFATSISLLFQYGVPLSHLVEKFGHMRFEPSGWTGNPEIGFAKSIVDYVFRWLGNRFLSQQERAELGLVRTSEVADVKPQLELLNRVVELAAPEPSEKSANGNGHAEVAEAPTYRRLNSTPDAPPCPRCGWLTVRSGTCHKCENCGETTGCS